MGATMVRPNVCHWPAAGDCERPYSITIEGRQQEYLRADAWGDPVWIAPGQKGAQPDELYPALWLDLEV